MPRYPMGKGPIDKAWKVIWGLNYAKAYIETVLVLNDAIDRAMYENPPLPKPKPLKVESERGDRRS